MKKLILIAIFILLFVGCSNRNIVEENVITGTVTEITENSILIQVPEEENAQYWVHLGDDTVFNGSSKEFTIGNTVKVEHKGEIMESYPMQVNAKRIIENKVD